MLPESHDRLLLDTVPIPLTSDYVRVVLSEDRLTMEPGQSGTVTITIDNGPRVLHYDIAVLGLDDEDWFDLSTNTTYLHQNGIASIALTIHPPEHGVRAQEYPFKVRVRAVEQSDIEVIHDLILDLRGEAVYALDLAPTSQRARGRGTFRVTVRNTGVADVRLRLEGRDSEDLCRFAYPRGETGIVAAESEREVPIQVIPKKRPWVGPDRTYAFKVTARPDDPQARAVAACGEVAGEYTYAPYFASWAPLWRLLAVLACVAILGAGYLALRNTGFFDELRTRTVTFACRHLTFIPPIEDRCTVSPPIVEPPASAPIVAPEPTPAPQPTPVPTPQPPPTPSSTVNHALQKAIGDLFGTLPQPASAVFRSLRGPESVTMRQDVPVPAASTIKLAIMIEVLRQAESGKLNLNDSVTVPQSVGGTGCLKAGQRVTLRQVLATTINCSDNTGGNMLPSVLGGGDAAAGMAAINATMRDAGFPTTQLGRPFMQVPAPGADNLTSARDMSGLLTHLYLRDLAEKGVSTNVSKAALDTYLAGRRTHERSQANTQGLDYLGRGLEQQDGLWHLNGLLSPPNGVRNDVGIVRLVDPRDGRPTEYVLAIFLQDVKDEAAAEAHIARVSKEVRALVLGH